MPTDLKEMWSSPVQAYLNELASTRRLSAHTISAYRRDLEGLGALLPDTPPHKVDASTLRRELARAHATGSSGRTLARRLSAWRRFFEWLAQQPELLPASTHHAIASNPARGIRAPRSEKRLPSALGVEATARLMNSPKPQEEAGSFKASWLSVQDDALFELLYSSGLRLAECVGLDLERLDMAQGLVTILGKGNRTRTVPVGQAALVSLQKWIHVRALINSKPEEKAVFIGSRKNRISPRTVQDRLARRGQRLGLPQRIHPHMLRHSCASHVLQSSADLRAVQELLGHASIASTQIYTHLDFQSLAQAYDAAHPRAQRSQGEPHEVPSSRPFRSQS